MFLNLNTFVFTKTLKIIPWKIPKHSKEVMQTKCVTGRKIAAKNLGVPRIHYKYIAKYSSEEKIFYWPKMKKMKKNYETLVMWMLGLAKIEFPITRVQLQCWINSKINKKIQRIKSKRAGANYFSKEFGAWSCSS